MSFFAGSGGAFRLRRTNARVAERRGFTWRIPCACGMDRSKAPLLLAFIFLFAMLPDNSALAEEYDMRGKASWYGTTAHGKRMASGEIFDRRSFSAAHRTLPFGTVLRVFNLKNRRHTLVRVADRGPFVRGRIVDVSRRAAEQLHMTRTGIASVAIEAISNARGEPLDRDNSFYLHMADGLTGERANALASRLSHTLKQPAATLFSLQGAHAAYVVCLGPYTNFEQAESVLIEIESKGARTRGVIEAHTKGGDVPRRVPPSLQRKHAKKNSPRQAK